MSSGLPVLSITFALLIFMKNILVLGAGKSSTVLIHYLLSNAVDADWLITVGDISLEAAQVKVGNHPKGNAIFFDVSDSALRRQSIANADIVLSLLPANMHFPVAKDCVQLGKNFISASYVSNEMLELHADAVKAGVILLNECGLDPGIDHMSAMELIHRIQQKGGKITAFESYTGGLIAPESDDNPWNYKFTWNPRNVVLAGQGVARFIWDNRIKYVPYHKLFERYDNLTIPGFGDFEGYPNRDSLKYITLYGLDNLDTMVRGTLRKKGFCDAWNVFVQLGVTDDSYVMEDLENMTWLDFIKAFIPYDTRFTPKDKLEQYLKLENRSEILQKLEWLGLFSSEPIGLKSGTPAQVLQKLLEDKWRLQAGDKDMCVMMHLIDYSLNGKKYLCQSSMAAIGDDSQHTAMAKTVGLPIAIAAKLILKEKLKLTGVVLPLTEEIYGPILHELQSEHGIHFTELEKAYPHAF